MSENFRDLSNTGKIPRMPDSGSGLGGSFDYSIPTAGGAERPAGAGNGRARASEPAFGFDPARAANGAPSGRNVSYASSGNSGRAYSSGRSSHSGRSAGGGGYRNTDSPRTPRSSGSRGGSAAVRRRKKQQRAVALGFLFLALLLGATVLVIVRSCNPPDQIVLDPATDAFGEGITINGTAVSGMTIVQAREVIQPGIEQDIAGIAITLAGDGFSETITGAQMNAVSDLEQVLVTALSGGINQAYKTALSLDYDALAQRILDINDALSYGPTDASFTLATNDSGKPELTYVPGKAGMGLDVEATEKLVQDALSAGDYSATLQPALSSIEPAVTVDDLKTQVTLLASYTTSYRKQLASDQPEEARTIAENRAFNVEKGADLINGVAIRPGKTWSFNDAVGDRTQKNGWKEAKGITGGETFNLQYGGGICQVSTTLYDAMLLSGIPFKDISRRHHSIPSDYVPLGYDATVDTDHIDLKFQNTTDYPIYIFTYYAVDKNRSRYADLTVYIYGQALPAGVTYQLRSETIEEVLPGEPIINYSNKQTTDYNVVTVEARNGYTVDVYRDKYVNGTLQTAEKLYQDEYLAIAEKRTIGTLEPVPSVTPPQPTEPATVTPAPGTDEQP